MALASAAVAGREAPEAVDDPVPGQPPPACVGDPPDLPGRARVAREQCELPVGDDPSARHAAQDRVDALPERRLGRRANGGRGVPDPGAAGDHDGEFTARRPAPPAADPLRTILIDPHAPQ